MKTFKSILKFCQDIPTHVDTFKRDLPTHIEEFKLGLEWTRKRMPVFLYLL